MNFPFEKKVLNIDEMKLVAKELSEIFTESNKIILNGNLGSGKTTLVKLIGENYNIFEVNSPSFSLVNEYNGDKKVYHFDFYRLEKVEELYDIGFEDYMNDEKAIVFIEWGNLMQEILPKRRYEIEIDFIEDEKRKLKIDFFKN